MKLIFHSYNKNETMKSKYTKASDYLKEYFNSTNDITFENCNTWASSLTIPGYLTDAIKVLINTIFNYLDYGVFIVTKDGCGLSPRAFLEDNIQCAILNEYLSSRKWTESYFNYVKYILLEFVYIITSFAPSIEELNYDQLDEYYNIQFSIRGECPSFYQRIIKVRLFLEYCANFGVINNTLGQFLTKEYHDYFVIMKELMHQIKIPSNLKNDNYDYNEYFKNEYVIKLKQLYKDAQYKRCYGGFEGNKLPAVDKFRIFIEFYHLSAAEESIEYWINNVVKKIYASFHEYRLIMLRYHEIVTEGIITFTAKNSYRTHYDDIPLWSKEMADKYISYRTLLGYNTKNTINMDKNCLARFLNHMNFIGIQSYDEIDESALKSFNENDSHKTAEGKNAYLVRVKSFLKYMHEYHGMKPLFMSIFLSGSRVPQKVINLNNDPFLEAAQNYTLYFTRAIDYRDYAIYLITIRTGLRAIDIVSLKFSNISFKDMSIRLIQSKTQKEIITNLSVDTANAIYKYLKYARPESDSEYVFLTSKAPYQPIDRTSAQNALKRMEKNIGIKAPKGFHELRRTFATKLLQKGRSVEEVALALGHEGTETVRKYLSLDEKKMAYCTLELKEIDLGVLKNVE